MSTRARLLLGCALALLSGSLPIHAESWRYTVRPGDDLWNLAARYCGSPSFAGRIAERNRLADPRLLRAGTRLEIPVAWLIRQPSEARVLAVSGTVQVHTPAPVAAYVSQEIVMGNRVVTQQGSVLVGFADGSTLLIAQDSDVLFNVLTAYGDTGMVDTNLRFQRGRATSRIRRGNDASRFRLSTPTGTAAVRGTEFRVGVLEAKTVTETLEGAVGFIQDREVAVPAGFGLAAGPAGSQLEPLLDAPPWLTPPGEVSVADAVRWETLGRAEQYRVSVFVSTEPDVPLTQRLTREAEFPLSSLEPGAYRVGLRGVSARGIEGYESVLALQVRSAPPLPASADLQTAGQVRLSWSASPSGPPYTLELSSAPGFDSTRTLQSALLAEDLPELAPGRYLWRVRDSASTFSDPVSVTVVPGEVSQLAGGRSETGALALRWKPAAGAQRYRVEIAAAADFSDPLVDVVTDFASYQTDLSSPGRYYLRVRGLAGDLAGAPLAAEANVPADPVWWPASFLLLLLLL